MRRVDLYLYQVLGGGKVEDGAVLHVRLWIEIGFGLEGGLDWESPGFLFLFVGWTGKQLERESGALESRAFKRWRDVKRNGGTYPVCSFGFCAERGK